MSYDEIFVDNPLFSEDDALENIDSASLEDLEIALKDAIYVLVGNGSGHDRIMKHMEMEPDGDWHWVDEAKKGDPEVEIAYAIHKRWASKLQAILNKVKKYRDRLHNEELS